jgi:hypothetical protein
MKVNLHNFFTITTVSTPNQKKCFIYDPYKKRASFEYAPNKTDIFLNTKSSIKLYYRPPKPQNKTNISPISDISTIVVKCNDIPLLKSNLQKAIRRCNKDIAVYSAIGLLLHDPIQFLRRLPIIYIEDVCLIDSYPIVVWLMMADKDYSMTSFDIDILLKIIMQLSLCSHVCNCTEDIDYTQELTPELLQTHPKANELLALFYRAQYGGMPGDIKMLYNAIHYYMAHPEEIQPMVHIDTQITMLRRILPESIDFHPYPHMLTMIEKQTGIDKEKIKQHIWFAESGCNMRKPETLELAEKYKTTNEWTKIKQALDTIRPILCKY